MAISKPKLVKSFRCWLGASSYADNECQTTGPSDDGPNKETDEATERDSCCEPKHKYVSPLWIPQKELGKHITRNEPTSPGKIFERSFPAYSSGTKFDLGNLPLEILLHIYSLSLNPSLCTVNKSFWRTLNEFSARLQFSVAVLDPNLTDEINQKRACRLQNWLLKRHWLNAEMAAKVDNIMSKQSRYQEQPVKTKQRKCTILSGSEGNTNFETQNRQTMARLGQNVYLPSALLKGPWTHERIELMGRLLNWGATVLAGRPICHKIPQRLLQSAISEGSVRAMSLCRQLIGTEYNHDSLRLAVLCGCREDVVSEIVLDCFRNDQDFIEWDDRTFWESAVATYDKEGPKHAWLMCILETKGRNIWASWIKENQRISGLPIYDEIGEPRH